MFQKAYTPAETFFGRRKCFAGLQELFADVTKGMHACGNFFRAAKMFRRSAGTFCGRRKRHACLRKLFSDGENVSQVCRNFLRTSQKACMPAETSFGTFQGRRLHVGHRYHGIVEGISQRLQESGDCSIMNVWVIAVQIAEGFLNSVRFFLQDDPMMIRVQPTGSSQS